MVTGIISANQAYENYHKRFPSMERVGKVVTMKNSAGNLMKISIHTRVYHRGKGRFSVYSEGRDKKHREIKPGNKNRTQGKGLRTLPKSDPRYGVGRGRFRNQHDGDADYRP